MNKPSLQQFEVFLTVAEYNSFTAAAKQLGISKAAVSQQIRQLEQNLKAPLFTRSTRRIALTDEGEQLQQQCLRLQNELDATRDLIGQFEAEPSGSLRISSNPYLVNTQLLPILQQYQQLFPKVKIELRTEERLPDMDKEGIDLIYGINWPPPMDIIARPIGKTRYVLCASPGYLARKGTPKKLSDLQHHDYIAHSGRNKNNIIAQLKSDTIPALNVILRTNNADSLINATKRGMGIAQVHGYMINEELKNGELVEVLSDCLRPSIDLYIYYQKHLFVQPKLRQLINLIMDH